MRRPGKETERWNPNQRLVRLFVYSLTIGLNNFNSIPTYDNEPNNIKAAKKYFGSHFSGVFQRSLKKLPWKEPKRTIFTHFTSVVDTSSTRVILSNGEHSSSVMPSQADQCLLVQDSILRMQLKEASLMWAKRNGQSSCRPCNLASYLHACAPRQGVLLSLGCAGWPGMLRLGCVATITYILHFVCIIAPIHNRAVWLSPISRLNL